MKRFTAIALMIGIIFCMGCSKEPSPGGGAASGSAQDSLPLPVISFAEIVAPNPTAENPMTLQYLTKGGESRPDLFRFRWYVNGIVVDDANSNVLTPRSFRKGSRVEAEITPTVDGRQGVPFRTQAVVVKNTPPVATSATLSPVPAFVGDTIAVKSQGSDIDGDEVSFEIQWLVNRTNVGGGEDGKLNTSELKKGTTVAAAVTPFDGTDRGELMMTTFLSLSNRNPEITSVPASGLQGGVYSYQVTAVDKDGDQLTYGLVTGPPGMTLDRASGLVRWEPPALLKGSQQINVKVSVDDGDGGVAFQEFNMTLELR